MLVKAKSKLYLAGEYAVLRKNCLAIIAAVDKYTYLEIEEYEKELVISDINDKDNLLYFSRKVAFDFLGEYKKFKYKYYTDLYNKNNKYGLGSSASVVVVTIKGILEYFKYKYTKDELFILSVKAMRLAGMKGSMGDVACVCYEDLILYKSLDENDKYDIKIIKPKNKLHIRALWTRVAASTSKQIKNLDINDSKYDEFCEKSNEFCKKMCSAIENNDNFMLINSIKNLRENLKYFSEISNICIFNDKINELIISDEYKPSGAGNGDFVVGLNLEEKNEKERAYEICFRM